MNYPVPPYGFVRPPPPRSGRTKILIIIGIVVAAVIIIGIVAIGLGVGLGVGLTRGSSDSSSSSSSSGGGGGSGSGSGSNSVLSAPSVTCTYGGSDTCGCSAVKPSFLSSKIVNGYTAVANSWPWMVALYINDNKTFCGGFLVSYQHVVTAAHCVSSVTGSILAYAGLSQLSTRNSAQARLVSTYTAHPSYSATTFQNDIAVLTLASAFTQTSTVGKCCLTSSTSLPSLDEHGVIIGWGQTSETSSGVSNDLLQGVIQVQSDSVCQEATVSTRFCAGYGGTDSCFGDSGSPFMTSVNNLWTCTGLVSAGRGCGVATLYTRTASFDSFINGIVNGKK